MGPKRGLMLAGWRQAEPANQGGPARSARIPGIIIQRDDASAGYLASSRPHELGGPHHGAANPRALARSHRSGRLGGRKQPQPALAATNGRPSCGARNLAALN